MAETKEKKVKVFAGTFPAASSDQAKKMLKGIEAAGLKGFAVKGSQELPGYIQVAVECEGKEAADKLIREAAEKKITLCIAE